MMYPVECSIRLYGVMDREANPIRTSANEDGQGDKGNKLYREQIIKLDSAYLMSVELTLRWVDFG